MNTLWYSNTPAVFWQITTIPNAVWMRAARRALPGLDLPNPPDSPADIPALVLGEGQFGPRQFELSRAKCLYYRLKPVLPRPLTRVMRQIYRTRQTACFPLGWPIEPRYAQFLWAVAGYALAECGMQTVDFTPFWPKGKTFAFVLTHDIETTAGQRYVRAVADLEESLGFRSSFNFVPERYPLDETLIADLKTRGFEIGVHGLNHDGRLFSSRQEFDRRALKINHYLDSLGAAGFRSPCTMRHPDWMQALAITYDSSFFDTDPHEPMCGGVMSLWPFRVGRFIELPYTLVQDHTLTHILRETTPRLWLKKLAFIAAYHGMALVNTHPDYLRKPVTWAVYEAFLRQVAARQDHWHALPLDVARWWCHRTESAPDNGFNRQSGQISLDGDVLHIALSSP
jgi:peptidoglycan/xylan/chitin deacetylase (PgdA/CDA1 family)